MDAKEKALKISLGTVAVLAVSMFVYYWFAWRNRTTVNDVNITERVDTIKEEKSEFAGIYSAGEPIEGMSRRLGFFTLTRKDDGSGYFGTVKFDKIAVTDSTEEIIRCNDVNIADKDFFIKCGSPEIGQISFVGEWSRQNGGLQVGGKVMWSKDGNVVTDKPATLTHSAGS